MPSSHPLPASRRSCRPSRRFVRPRLEIFEDRLAPAVFTVVSALSGDPNVVGTLANCIQQANLAPGADTIVFAATVSGVTLTGALPTIIDDVTIQGQAGGRTTVVRDAGAAAFRIFDIAGAASVTLTRLEIANGVATTGGGIFNSGDLTVTDCLIRGNTATGGNSGGGGIFSNGQLVLARSHLLSNQSTASDSVGGGLFLFNASATVVDTTFQGNTASFGGGLLVESFTNDVLLDIVNSTFSGNSRAYNGGAIHTLANGATISLFLTHCTITNNNATGTGGVFNFGRNGAASTVSLLNTVLANNAGTSLGNHTAADFTGQIDSLGNNVASDTTGFLNQPTDRNSADAKLGPLRDNGGAAPTHALLPGSAALNAGAFVSDFPQDSRGIDRPQGGAVDSGAFESRPFLTSLTGGGQSAEVNTTFASPIVLQLTEGAANVLPEARVTFSIVSGATFVADGGVTFVATTDANGLATSSAIRAGGTAGPIEVRATLDDGTTPSAFLTVTPPPNQAPSGLQLTASPNPVFEGEVFTLSGTFTDAEPDEGHFVSIDWRDGTFEGLNLAAGVFAFTATHVYIGPLSFEPQVTRDVFVSVVDQGEQQVAGAASVTIVNAAPVVAAGDDEFVNVGATFVRAGSFTDSEEEQGVSQFTFGEGQEGSLALEYTASVDYGDGTGVQSLELTDDGRFVLSHVYQVEGSFEVFVTVTDSRSATGAAAFTADVLLPGVPTPPADKATAAPGQTATAVAPGVSATLIRDFSGTGDAAIIVAIVPTAVADGLDPAFAGSNSNLITDAYDVRAVNVGVGDRAVITFQYSNDDFDLPTVTFFNKATGQQQAVSADLFVVDRLARTVTLVLDATTTPRLQDLGGTVFTISVPVGVAAPSIVSSPVTALLSVGQSDTRAELAGALAGEVSVAANTLALAQFAPADEGGSFPASAAGDEAAAGAEGGEAATASELPPGPTGLIGLQAATATASFPEVVSDWRPGETEKTDDSPPAEGGASRGEPERGGEQEEVEAEGETPLSIEAGAPVSDEVRDETFATLGPAAAGPAELLLVAVALLNLPARREGRSRSGRRLVG